jgi:uncharacterized paraquat-inducible protein A
MYCSSCGAESTPGLNYCNRCGTGLNTQTLPTRQEAYCGSLTKPILILGGTVTFLSLCGFGILTDAAAKMARNGFSQDPVMLMLLMGMVTILIVDIMLLKQLSRFVSAALQPGTGSARQAKEMSPPKQTSRQLNSRPEPIPSVTENTTRTFEPIYRESNR